MTTINVYQMLPNTKSLLPIGRVTLAIPAAMPFGVTQVWLPVIRALPAFNLQAPRMVEAPTARFYKYPISEQLTARYLLVDCPGALMMVENAVRFWEE